MKGESSFSRPRERGNLVLGAIVGLGLAFSVVLVSQLANQALRDVESLKSATSDNVQWTLSQAEVELLGLQVAVEQVMALNPEQVSPQDLDAVRKAFDIFFSRLATLSSGRLFAELNKDPAFSDTMQQAQRVMHAHLAVIDGTDTDLVAALPAMRHAFSMIQPAVRTASVQGLVQFAEQSDLRREALAGTLRRLLVLVVLLFSALTTVSLYLLIVNRRTLRRRFQVEQMNQRMATILSTSQDAVVVVDSAGRIREFSPAAERMFGYSAQDVIGRDSADILVPRGIRRSYLREMRNLKQESDGQGARKEPFRFKAMRRNGEVLPIELTVQTALDGPELIIVGFIRDMSRQIADERELIAARDHALEGERIKAEFLTVMSHEIRTPLNGMLGNLSLLEETELSPVQTRYVRSMDISGRLLMSHVDAVLDIASLEAGKVSVNIEKVCIDELLQDIVDSQGGSAAARGNAIAWGWVGTAAPWVETDPKHLQQILLNLVGNAIKFTENGRIDIEVELSFAGPSDNGTGSLLEVRVIDTGIGIPEDQLDLVFEDFRTTDASFHRAAGGTGLGLGIARRLTHNLGGEIGVASEPGEGSAFYIQIPVTRASGPQARPLETLVQGPLSKQDVLVVEDNEINLKVVVEMLEREGYRVTAARDGHSAVEEASKRFFDLILMDISMPVMDGLEAARRIREGDGASARSQIVAFTANVLPGDARRYKVAGMNGVLGKPLTFQALRDHLSGLPSEVVADREQKDPTPASQIEDRLAELRTALGDVEVSKLLHLFGGECADLLHDISTPLAGAGARGDMARRCHQVAGSAAVLGLNGLQAILARMEEAAQILESEEFSILAAEFGRRWETSRKSLGV
ncbi:hybrid sensor histidine kinase/response regulator [Ruegeria marina]|uniref:histidine kinase n=1 Tax=Ruegeria marina TaxID=639004 RepID=A0A1G6SL92_9RHOB|nr:ATP-binding protein [Ruegeria marina]SDD16977.1 PAS domain S-box-containing protein [Ruegeria marina]